MNFFERINKNREDRIFRQIRSGNIDEKTLVKIFKSSNNKINFIQQCNSILKHQLPEKLLDAIIECAERDTDFLIRVCPLIHRK